MSVTTEIKTITPKHAEALMGKNNHNRNLTQGRVATLAADMLNGEWVMTGESIKISKTGVLLDGQHRLAACIQAGVSFKTLVVNGLDDEAQNSMDVGRPRRFSDQLKLAGEKNPLHLAALVRAVYMYTTYGGKGLAGGGANPAPSMSQLANTLAANPGLRDCQGAGKYMHSKIPTTVTILAFTTWLFGGIDHEDAEDFFDKLMTGIGFTENDPIYRLREAILAEARRTASRADQQYMMALFIKAWNAYRNGTEIQNLRWRRGGSQPEQFPDPV